MDNTPAPNSTEPIINPTVGTPDASDTPDANATTPSAPITPEQSTPVETVVPAIEPSPQSPASTVDTPQLTPPTPPIPPALSSNEVPPVSSEPESVAPTVITSAPSAMPAPTFSPVGDMPPAAPATADPASSSHKPLPQLLALSQLPLKAIGIAVACLLILAVTAAVSYAMGTHATKPMASTSSDNAAFTLPAGATIIEQCSPGLGTQYVLPKNIPNGPVYNVYQGKLIGVEYMEDLASMEKLNTMLTNLPLFGQKYDHINIMSMAAHAGMPVPHYQVDVMMVSDATASKITCGNSSSMSNMSGSSSTMSNSSSSSKM